MVRPLSQNPWGRRPRRRRIESGPPVLEVPVVSPQRALHALRVTVKPHDWTREAIRHRLSVDASGSAEQPWRVEWRQVAEGAIAAAAQRLGVKVRLACDADASVHLRAIFAEGTPEELARAVGVVLSSHLPETWFTLGRLALLRGQFWRRERGYGLHLRPAKDVHLPRAVRGSIRDLLGAR